jgi:hypothetical protein
VEKASVSTAGAFTSTSIDATKLTGALPALDGSALTGITHVGGATALSLNDNVKAQFGASQDLQIYHDGTNNHSYIKESGTGDLRIEAQKVGILSADGSETMAEFNPNAEVALRYDNSIKLSTTATGITTSGLAITGPITEQETSKTASFTPNLTTDGTIFKCSGTMTITMPAVQSGKSFTIIHATATSITWAGTIKWPLATVPAASSGVDIYVFVSDGTNWYGIQSGTGFA